jgi:hypothetical protein
MCSCPPIKRERAKVRLQPLLTPFSIGDRVFDGYVEVPDSRVLAAAMGSPEKHKHPPSGPFSDVLVSKRVH